MGINLAWKKFGSVKILHESVKKKWWKFGTIFGEIVKKKKHPSAEGAEEKKLKEKT